MLKIGSEAAAFDLDGSGGSRISSADPAGKFAILVFYPKNNTPG